MRTAPISTPVDGAFVHPVRTDDDLAAFHRWMDCRHIIAVDTETSGLSFQAEARLIQVSDATAAWVFDAQRHPLVVDELANGEFTMICHNAAFDAIVLGRLLADYHGEGLPYPPVVLGREVENLMSRMIDTQVLAHLVDPRPKEDGGRGHALKVLADHYLGAGSVDSQDALKVRFRELGISAKDGFAEVPIWDEVYVRYSGVDPILTFRLYEVLAPMVDELGLTKLAAFEQEVATVCAAMTARGIRVDLDHARATLAHLAEERVAAEREASIYGVHNVHSPAQVAEALLVRGVELTERTEAGAWKMDKAVLSGIDDPVARAVQKAKAASKAASSWITPLIEQAEVDGRVHARVRTVGARTGRMSVHGPGLQQLPTTDWRVRRCLVPDEWQSIVLCDYNQLEPRVIAYLADEQNLITAFRDGVDVYSAIAERLYGVGFPTEKRALAKQALLAKIYQAGPKRLAAQTGVTEVVATQTMNAFDRAYPRLARWSKRLIETCKFNGQVVTTASGRRLPVTRGTEYRAVNHLTQATAADIFKGSIVNLARAGHAERLLMVVHDELVLQADEQVAGEFGEIVTDVMSGVLGEVPISALAKVAGPSWGHPYMPVEFVNA